MPLLCKLSARRHYVSAALESGVKEFPHIEEIINNIDDKFSTFANPKTGKCSFEGFQGMLTEVDNGLRALPATAQVAKQEGEYLADFFIACDGDANKLAGTDSRFDYVHKGSLAYIGKNAAVADIPGFTIVKGFAAGIIWKSFETISQFSTRNVLLVASDMIRTKLFGRDISRFNP